MIGEFFLKLLNISITASWLILAVIIVRLLFRRMPKWINCLLWGIVAFKLCCPFSIESVFSLQPSSEPIRTITTTDSGEVISQIPTIDSNLSFVTEKVNPALKKTFENKGTTNTSQSALQSTAKIAGYIWLSVMIILILYAIASIVRMRFKLREAVAIEKNTYLCDTVETPFILGIIRPRIYLPSTLEDEEIGYILAHEKAHLKRLDNIWKPLGYVLFSIYWFNPLCIISYLLLCKDIELACDEKVIRDMSFAYKKEYSRVLLSCATRRRFVLAYPLAFGEIGVKERIKNVLNYKKRALGVTILAFALGILIAVCFLTNPSTKTADVQEDSQNDNTPPSEISNEDYKSDKNSSIDDVRLGTYQNSIFLDAFAGYFFESDNYKEPKHGFAPKEWCVLGGIGQCIDSNYEEHEVFSDGNLVECHYMDNHMSVDEMRAFTTDKYSACVYKYEFDLFTAADEENADLTANDPTTSTYWVVFFTEGEGMPLYIKYFNSSYYTMEKAMDSISTDPQQVDGTTDASSTQADEILELRKKLSTDNNTSSQSPSAWGYENGKITFNNEEIYNITDIASGTEENVAMQAFGKVNVYVAYFSTNGQINILYLDFTGDAEIEKSIDYTQYGGPGTIYMSFYDEETGYILYCSDPGAGQMNKILWSYGNHGDDVQLVADLSDVIEDYPCALSFKDKDSGIILTTYHGSDNYAYRSNDSGKNWNPLSIVSQDDYSYIDGISAVYDFDNRKWAITLKMVDNENNSNQLETFYIQ